MEFVSSIIDIKEMMNDITLKSLAEAAGGALQSLYLSFPPEKLKTSIAEFDAEFEKLKKFFGKREFNLKTDSLYFIYNAHNIALKKMYDAMQFTLDQQTGYVTFKHQKGYDNEFPSTG